MGIVNTYYLPNKRFNGTQTECDQLLMTNKINKLLQQKLNPCAH